MIFFRNFFEGGGRQIQVCPRAPDTLATPLDLYNDYHLQLTDLHCDSIYYNVTYSGRVTVGDSVTPLNTAEGSSSTY